MSSRAIETLMHEHRFIEGVLDGLESFVNGPGVETTGARERLREFVEFFRTFADRCHHGKEEDILFRELTRRATPADGPISVMLEEHETGRALVGTLAEAAEGRGLLTKPEWEGVRTAALGFSEMLRAHIQKEDQILYPLAERLLPAEELAAMADRFEDFERDTMGEGVHESMHALAARLSEAALR